MVQLMGNGSVASVERRTITMWTEGFNPIASHAFLFPIPFIPWLARPLLRIRYGSL
jgi:hypothetical protein